MFREAGLAGVSALSEGLAGGGPGWGAAEVRRSKWQRGYGRRSFSQFVPPVIMSDEARPWLRRIEPSRTVVPLSARREGFRVGRPTGYES